MRVSPVRLPRLLGTLVMGFAPFEPLPLLGAAQLFTGMAIELAYRWANGQMVASAENSAVLLWSRTTRGVGRRWYYRELFGILVATVVGITLVLVCNTVLFLPLGVLLVAAGVATRWVTDIVLGLIGARLCVIGWRAVRSFRSEVALSAGLPEPRSQRWRIDFLAAVPARSGNGGRLLDTFLRQADEEGAEVVLHCERRNVAFYRKHDFRLLQMKCPGDHRLMQRRPQTAQATSGSLTKDAAGIRRFANRRHSLVHLRREDPTAPGHRLPL